MVVRHSKKILGLLLPLSFLTACGSIDPYAKDWDRNRITEIPSSFPTVGVCFDRSYHSRAVVEEIALQQCRIKGKEIENLRLNALAQQARFASKAEGDLFAGPIAREQQLEAILSTLSVHYVDNERFSCSLLMPNSVTYECRYDPNVKVKQPAVQQSPIPSDLVAPEALPEGLRP